MVNITTFNGTSSGAIEQSSITKDLGPKDVLIRVTHSGLCGTDTHYRTTAMALGHEGTGVVEDVGKGVTLFKKGDRAGWGYMHDTCGHCKQCLRGAETFCPQRDMYGVGSFDQGSFASHAVWKEDFVFRIPDAISSEHAAPLQCGGATVFNALQFHGVRPTDRVGVIGLGGLGHLAIQFASAMGCEVAVFSGSDSKKEEAIKLGAKEFYAMKNIKDISKECNKPLDHLLVTTSAQPAWDQYLSIMAPSGIIYPLTISGDDLKMPYMPVLLSGLRIQGSLVAARQIHREMLEFAAYHNIAPITQTFPLTKHGVEKAFETLESGQMRYRGVLVAQ